MSRSTTPASPASDCPEYVVARESFDRYFDKPMPTSTFHDLVQKGKIIPFKHMRGRFLLNASLRRLGLREVSELPQPSSELSLEEIVRLAFSLIDPLLFPEPSWMLHREAISAKDAEHAIQIYDRHRDYIEDLDDPHAKIAYLHGVLDWASMMENGGAHQDR